MVLSLAVIIDALRAYGCEAQQPRYPLVHQQPLFTEGHFTKIARLPAEIPVPVYRSDALPRTQDASEHLLRLPSFPSADRPLLDQYVLAFRKVLACAAEIRERTVQSAPPQQT